MHSKPATKFKTPFPPLKCQIQNLKHSYLKIINNVGEKPAPLASIDFLNFRKTFFLKKKAFYLTF